MQQRSYLINTALTLVKLIQISINILTRCGEITLRANFFNRNISISSYKKVLKII